MANYDHPAITWTVISKDFTPSDALNRDELEILGQQDLLPWLANAFPEGSGEIDGTGFGYGYPNTG